MSEGKRVGVGRCGWLELDVAFKRAWAQRAGRPTENIRAGCEIVETLQLITARSPLSMLLGLLLFVFF